jgi:transcriptional pleiotropic repressor
MRELLEKARAINRLIQRSAGYPVNFVEVAAVLSSNIDCNAYVLDEQGKVLGHNFMPGFACDVVQEIVEKAGFPKEYNDYLLSINEVYANFCQTANACVFNEKLTCRFNNKVSTIVPIIGGGSRLGTLVLAKFDQEFSDGDLLLAEYGASLVALEILRARIGRMEEEARKLAAVQVALGTLSYSELDAVRHIFDELKGSEGLLVASKIADRVGITRSVIVNALRSSRAPA